MREEATIISPVDPGTTAEEWLTPEQHFVALAHEYMRLASQCWVLAMPDTAMPETIKTLTGLLEFYKEDERRP